jgi:hypothetical protein
VGPALWVGRLLAALLTTLLTVLVTLEHPATRQAAMRMATRRDRIRTERRMPAIVR